MNTHLSESEFVDLVEETLDPRRAAHVETCASCREQAGALRAMLRDTASIDVPEPSPLFWEHFAARVRDEIAAEPAGRRSGWAWTGVRGLVPFATAAALIVAVVSGLLLVRAGRGGPMPSTVVSDAASVATSAGSDRPAGGVPDPDNAEVWAVLTTAASSVEFEAAHDAGMHVHPAAIDHAVQDLSAAELTELGRLLQAELKRSSN
jgi:hypothetical protein